MGLKETRIFLKTIANRLNNQSYSEIDFQGPERSKYKASSSKRSILFTKDDISTMVYRKVMVFKENQLQIQRYFNARCFSKKNNPSVCLRISNQLAVFVSTQEMIIENRHSTLPFVEKIKNTKFWLNPNNCASDYWNSNFVFQTVNLSPSMSSLFIIKVLSKGQYHFIAILTERDILSRSNVSKGTICIRSIYGSQRCLPERQEWSIYTEMHYLINPPPLGKVRVQKICPTFSNATLKIP